MAGEMVGLASPSESANLNTENTVSDTITTQNSSRRKSAFEVSHIGNPSNGGTLKLIVLLDDPEFVATSTEHGSGDTRALPEDITTLISLLESVFRRSFTDPRALGALATISDRVAVMRLPRKSVADACDAVIAEFEKANRQ